MNNWLSVHFYPLETQDVFLARTVKPFLAQHVWPQKDTRAFFIRYQDEKGPHIRLRIRAEAALIESAIKPAIEEWFSGKGEWMELPYVRELERFGGESALKMAEEYFHLSTRVVLERISRDQFTYGDAMFDALRLHVITAYSAGFTRDRSRWYFEQLFGQWLPLFFPSDEASLGAEITSSFETTFSPQKEKISAILDAFWKTLEAEQFDEKQPEWQRWLEANQLILKALEENLAKVLPSLIHLTNNRLGINNQDEVYLNYILYNALQPDTST